MMHNPALLKVDNNSALCNMTYAKKHMLITEQVFALDNAVLADIQCTYIRTGLLGSHNGLHVITVSSTCRYFSPFQVPERSIVPVFVAPQ